jgi:hypothetical protein
LPAGWIVAGALAVAMAALMAFQAGKRSAPDRGAEPAAVPAAVPTLARAAELPQPAAVEPEPPVPSLGPTLTPSFQNAVMEVTIPRPSPAIAAAALNPTPEPLETLHEEMTRCLVFTAAPDTDSWHPFLLQLKVQVKNRCDVSFAGQEVWFEVRAVLPKTKGAVGRETGRFQEPILARGLAETHIAMRSLDPDGFSREGFYRFETKLWWASGGGRNAGE